MKGKLFYNSKLNKGGIPLYKKVIILYFINYKIVKSLLYKVRK